MPLSVTAQCLHSSGLDERFYHVSNVFLLLFGVFSARCNIYISRYDVSVRLSVCLSVRPSVRLSVTEVHCGHGACREERRGHLALS